MNRLATETSPYLLQHADNPVDWYPWGDEAFAAARERDVPVLLSVGYAACHWCHVMAHESFEDPETAAVMNEHFVCIKVDREERPDVDGIYMEAVQAMTGSGGWPMTAFLTPLGEPFYAGTYFPPEPRHGMPAFRQVLLALAQAWTDDREGVVGQAGRVADVLREASPGPASEDTRSLSDEDLMVAWAGLRQAFDPANGGFGGAPKFPQPMTLEFALRAQLRGWAGAAEMVAVTLGRMARGGIHDQIGGGFHRYSTDARWLVPHFEKMLYDNAQLARLYLHAFQVTREPAYERVVRSTLDYLLREMRQPAGGFSSSQDADSEGVEGRFFVWSWDELAGAVGEERAARFGASPDGNWEGTNVLWVPGDEPDDDARAELFARREPRVRPGTDDKVITAWNGLAISALAEGGRVLHEPRYTEAAEGAAGFVLSELRRPDGRLLRSWRQGRAQVPAFCDDYALLSDALLTLHAATGAVQWAEHALGTVEAMLALFAPDSGGPFFQTGADAEALLTRPREVFDNAVPSGNSVAATVLLRLALLTGDAAYERKAVSVLQAVRDHALRFPTGFGQALSAVAMATGPTAEVAIVGALDDPRTQALIDEAWSDHRPDTVVAVGKPDPQHPFALLDGRTTVEDSPAAYVCEHFACKMPVTDPAALATALSG